MIINMICAMGSDRSIGDGKNMPWETLPKRKEGRPLRQDMINFVKLTGELPLIMGRKTFESFGGKPLPNRLNIVLSSEDKPEYNGLNIMHASSLEDALGKCSVLDHKECFIIGGAAVYEEGFKYADNLYLTIVDMAFNSPVKFPENAADLFELYDKSGEIYCDVTDLTYQIHTCKRIAGT